MLFSAIASTLALALLAPVSASPLTTRQDSCAQSGDYIWKLDNVYIRKINSPAVSTVGFDIQATNGGTLNFTCTPHDDAGNDVTENFTEKVLYSCGTNSGISFALQTDGGNRLLLVWKISDTETLIGTTTLNTYCHAGGAGPQDFVCTGVAPSYITLANYEASTIAVN